MKPKASFAKQGHPVEEIFSVKKKKPFEQERRIREERW